MADEPIVVIFNHTPEVRHGYRLGVPVGEAWEEVLNTDDTCFGGSGVINAGPMITDAVGSHGYKQSLELTLPPLQPFLKRTQGAKS